MVADPLVALGRLSRHLVDRGRAQGLRVVGITGSQGKTSTKDLLAQVLETVGPTVAPIGNLNNELGVPLTVSRITEQTRFLVAEMGARGIGHIAYLCDLAPPQVAVVLNVGYAHLGEFGSRSAIAQAKGELVEALPTDGTAVLNADDPLVWAMRTRTRAAVLPFSVGREPPRPDGPLTDCDPRAVWAGDVVGDELGRHSFTLHARGPDDAVATAAVRLPLTGRHQVDNAVAAAAAALALGVGLPAVAGGLSTVSPRSRWRMEMTERADGVLVINDAYNANPDSMRAAVTTLAEIGRRRNQPTWAVLGDMLELGAEAESEHARLGRIVAEQGIDHLIAVGLHAGTVVEAARATRRPSGTAGGKDGTDGGWAEVAADKSAASATLVRGARAGNVVLVKASRGLALNTVADDLLLAAPSAAGCPANPPSPRKLEDPA